MSSIKTKVIRGFNTRVSYLVAAMALLVGSIAPVTLASADAITDRSIAMSSSSADASGVGYTMTFTPKAAAGAFVVQFCDSDSGPDPAVTCVAPSGFSASAVETSDASTTVSGTANTITVVKSLTANTPTTVNVTKLHNPTDAATFYARIFTYDTDTNAGSFPAATGQQDVGGVALATTPTVGVTGAVLETLTFCVAKVAITANCANANANLPTLKLGETTGSKIALDAAHVSTGDLFAQLSSNAAKGVVVNLKVNNDCGGLKRAGASICDIAPVTDTNGIAQGAAKFGVKVAADSTQDGVLNAATAGTTVGDTVAPVGNYATDYFMDWVSGNLTGVTSVYGSPVFQTATPTAPVTYTLSNRNVKFTFGASISNATPAGNYGADMSMIATGTF